MYMKVIDQIDVYVSGTTYHFLGEDVVQVDISNNILFVELKDKTKYRFGNVSFVIKSHNEKY